MSRWTGVVALAVVGLVPACKEKQAAAPEPAQISEMKPITSPATPSEPVTPGVASPVPAVGSTTGLPPACERYAQTMKRLADCQNIPQTTRDAIRDAFTQTVPAWSSVPPEGKAALEGACKSADDALQQAMVVCGKDPGPGSRDVPGERGVPLDRAVLGSLPHPFGALEVLKPQITREEILSALPNARREGDDQVTVPIGVEDLIAQIDIDYSGHLDVVRIKLPDTARELLVKAWGQPTALGTWFDRKKRWRADLGDDGELMIGPFTPLAELLGKGPDGLAETKGVIGASPAELTARFGARVREIDDEGDTLAEKPVVPAAKRFELLLPATEICKFFTVAELEVTVGHVSALHLSQCFDDEPARRAALAALESKWGRAVPGRGADDRPVFTFGVPGRRVEVTLDENAMDHPGWQIAITAR